MPELQVCNPDIVLGTDDKGTPTPDRCNQYAEPLNPVRQRPATTMGEVRDSGCRPMWLVPTPKAQLP